MVKVGNYTEEDEEGTLHALLVFILHGSLPLDYQPSMRSLSVLVFFVFFCFCVCYFCDGVIYLAKCDSVLCLAKRGGVFCLAKRDGVFVWLSVTVCLSG